MALTERPAEINVLVKPLSWNILILPGWWASGANKFWRYQYFEGGWLLDVTRWSFTSQVANLDFWAGADISLGYTIYSLPLKYLLCATEVFIVCQSMKLKWNLSVVIV